MHVQMFARMHVCISRTNSLCTERVLSARMHVRMFARMHVCENVSMHVCSVDACLHVCINVRMNV